MVAETQCKKFSEIAKGIFFIISSVSVIIMMLMFVFVWQPIWVKGFGDFHTISDAISKLDKTAKPASAVAPLVLSEMSEMNQTIKNMDFTMIRINYSMEQMTLVLQSQMGRMNYEVDRMGDKISPMGMMPFNW